MGEDPYILLQEWLDLWANSDTMPNKLPNSLHTRTQVVLVEHEFAVKRQSQDTEAHAWPGARDTDDSG